MDLRDMHNGVEDTQEMARAAFAAAWSEMLPSVAEAQVEEWSDYSRHDDWVLAMRAAGRQLPTLRSEGQAVCFGGATISTEVMYEQITESHRDLRVPGDWHQNVKRSISAPCN